MPKDPEIVAVGTVGEKIFKVVRISDNSFNLSIGRATVENVPFENAITWVITQFSQAMGSKS